MNDLISRQSVKNWLAKWEGYIDHDLIARMQCRVIDIPSAQPEPCEDAVSRRILLNDLKELITAWEKYPVMAEQIKGVAIAIGYVKAIPSVTPKRKTGKWIYNSPVTMKCNQCGLVIKDWDWHRFKYCPNCYSDMRGGRE